MFKPIIESRYPGVIYRLITVFADPEGRYLKYLGWQPLHRPEQQRAIGVCLQAGQDLMAIPGSHKFHFRHEEVISKRVFAEFNKGEILFPRDAAAELAKHAKSLNQFTRDQINRSWERLEEWSKCKFENKDRENIERQIGLEEIKNEILSWDFTYFNLAELEDQLQKVLQKVRYRRVYYQRN
jgi:hypothetical protein